jgi:hypothetical protein
MLEPFPRFRVEPFEPRRVKKQIPISLSVSHRTSIYGYLIPLLSSGRWFVTLLVVARK